MLSIKGTLLTVNNKFNNNKYDNNEDQYITEYTFSTKSDISFHTISYVLQEFAKKQKHLIISNNRSYEYNYDYKKFKEIIQNGSISFEWERNLYNFNFDYDSFNIKLISNNNVKPLVDILKYKIRYENPLRGKLIQIKQVNINEFYPIINQVPKITFDDVIIDEKLKEDIYDNTIFQLKNMKENNGLIFYGEPGTGKSLMCSAIANECVKTGNTVCYLSGQVDYTMLNEFLENFISPCILIFEDIDSFGQSRELKLNSTSLSDFLQFINGISEKEEKIIFIATTNYLDKLDDAISNRPVRFNRKFKFDYPTNSEISKLIELYFNKDISDKFSEYCYNKKFTGSHIKEIQRTANLLSKKRNVKIDEVFKESVDLVMENFSPKLLEVGFNSIKK